MRRTALFLVPLLLAPSAIVAVPGPNRLLVAPAAGRPQTIDGLKVTTRLVKRQDGQLTVMVSAENLGEVAVQRTLRVEVADRRPSSPMARMMPMPVRVGTESLDVALGPRERTERELTIKAARPATVGWATFIVVRSEDAGEQRATAAMHRQASRGALAQNAVR